MNVGETTHVLARQSTLDAAAPGRGRPLDSAPDLATSFEALYLAHRDNVFRYLRARSRDEEEALDLAATTFERALRALERRPDVTLGLGWLLRTARNAAIDSVRRRRTAELLSRLLGLRHPDRGSPETAFLEAERATRLRAALRSLPDRQRDAISLRFATDLAIHEIGEILGQTESATQKQISRGLVRLREALDGD